MKFSTELLHNSLKKFFGFNSFKGKQEEIIKDLMNEEDIMVIMPTGGGKSMCYQLPALITDGVAIIISPLIALMTDQIRHLRSKNIKCEGNPYEDWWVDPAIVSEDTWRPFRTDIGSDSMEVILK